MAVHVENIGGGGSTSSFPPKGTQVQIFTDTFNRPDVETLGTGWGMAWQSADFPFDVEAFNRPRPFDAAWNPRIENNRLVWFARRPVGDQGRAYSFAWPWKLAWMTQDKFDQFAEIQIDSQYERISGLGVNIELACVYAQSSGSMTPDTYLSNSYTGAYGGYSLSIASTFFVFVHNMFGANPSYSDGPRGIAGLNYVILGDGVDINGPFPRIFRLEARWTGTTWVLTALMNGIVLATREDSHLLQGMPALGVGSYDDLGQPAVPPVDPSHVCDISRFTGGLL